MLVGGRLNAIYRKLLIVAAAQENDFVPKRAIIFWGCKNTQVVLLNMAIQIGTIKLCKSLDNNDSK